MAAISAAQQALEALSDEQAIDPKLRLDTVEGQSDALELLDRYAETIMADETLAELASARARRLNKRAAVHRIVMERMLVALELGEAIERAAYTASLSYRAGTNIIDMNLIPRHLMRPDLVALGKLLHRGEKISGAELGNPQPHLLITTR
jgi:hypothetical protein